MSYSPWTCKELDTTEHIHSRKAWILDLETQDSYLHNEPSMLCQAMIHSYEVLENSVV